MKTVSAVVSIESYQKSFIRYNFESEEMSTVPWNIEIFELFSGR